MLQGEKFQLVLARGGAAKKKNEKHTFTFAVILEVTPTQQQQCLFYNVDSMYRAPEHGPNQCYSRVGELEKMCL